MIHNFAVSYIICIQLTERKTSNQSSNQLLHDNRLNVCVLYVYMYNRKTYRLFRPRDSRGRSFTLNLLVSRGQIQSS